MNRREVLAGPLALVGCAVAPEAPDIDRLYGYADAIPIHERRPIVTIPGMLGSRLRQGRGGPFLWGGPGRLSADPAIPEEARRLPYHLVTGDTSKANYSSLRAGLVEFRRRIE